MGGSLCVDKPEENKKKSDHKKQAKLSEQMSKNAKDRLKREFSLFTSIVLFNEAENYQQSMSTCIEHFTKSKCKAQQGYECQFKGYCAYCGDFEFNEEDLKLIDGFSQANFKYNSQICLQIIGPQGSVYAGRYYNLFVNIPTNYPDEPPVAYFGNQMYHLNVNSDTNQILSYRISKEFWRREMRIF